VASLLVHQTSSPTTYLCSILNSQVNSNGPCTEDDLKDSIQSTVLSVSAAELQGSVNNMFLRCDKCVCVCASVRVSAKGKHFQHLLDIW